MRATTPSLVERIRFPAAIGLAIGLIRYVLEFVAPERAMLFGVYYVMPVVFAVVGWRGDWGPIRWPQLALSMLVLCLIVWGITNTVAYTTGQFLGWNHGRFFHDSSGGDESRAAPIAATALGKIGWGFAQGGLTALAGTVWCTVFGTVLIWLPARLRQRSAA